jgi:hypothetical protein
MLRNKRDSFPAISFGYRGIGLGKMDPLEVFFDDNPRAADADMPESCTLVGWDDIGKEEMIFCSIGKVCFSSSYPGGD